MAVFPVYYIAACGQAFLGVQGLCILLTFSSANIPQRREGRSGILLQHLAVVLQHRMEQPGSVWNSQKGDCSSRR